MASVGLEAKTTRGAFETLGLEMRAAERLDKVKVFGVAFFSALAALLTAPAALRGINIFQRLVTHFYPSNPTRYTDIDAEQAKKLYHWTDIEIPYNKNEDGSLTLQFANGRNVQVLRTDIFESGASVLVSPANIRLGTQGNGGLNAAIIDKGGEAYKLHHDALRKQKDGSFKPGDAATLPSGNLKDRSIDEVIVVAPPNRRGKSGPVTAEEKKQLFACYYNALVLAEQGGQKTIAMPSLGTGINGFPADLGANICQQAIHAFYAQRPASDLVIKIYAVKDDEFNAFRHDAMMDDLQDVQGGDVPEEAGFRQLAEPEIYSLEHGDACSPHLALLYARYLQKECPQFYFAENYVCDLTEPLPNDADLICVPVPITGVGLPRCLASPADEHLFSEDHFAAFFIDRKSKTIYYFEPKGYEFHDGLNTKAGLGIGPSVPAVYQRLSEQFPGFRLVQNKTQIQYTMNTVDCVVHVCRRMEDHLEAPGQEPRNPREINQVVRNEMADTLRALFPAVGGGSDR